MPVRTKRGNATSSATAFRIDPDRKKIHEQMVDFHSPLSEFVDIKPWQQLALNGLCAALTGQPVKAPTTLPERADKEYQSLFWRVLEAMSRGEGSFGPALERYLLDEYAPVAERNARYELNSKNIMCCGKWTLFPAAVCQVMGTAPALDQRTALYAPLARCTTMAASGSVPEAAAAAAAAGRRQAPCGEKAAGGHTHGRQNSCQKGAACQEGHSFDQDLCHRHALDPRQAMNRRTVCGWTR